MNVDLAQKRKKRNNFLSSFVKLTLLLYFRVFTNKTFNRQQGFNLRIALRNRQKERFGLVFFAV